MDEYLTTKVKELEALTDRQFTELVTLAKSHFEAQVGIIGASKELTALQQAALEALEKERNFTQDQILLYKTRIHESLIEREKKTGTVDEGAAAKKKTKE